MALRYARAGGGNWSADATWSTTSGGAADTVAPTAADDALLNASSGAVTINSGATRVCRSIDCNGYTGTLSHNTSTNLDIGDATAGAGNIALRFGSGMTYSPASVNTCLIQFISTSTTQQTIDTAGKNIPRFLAGGSSDGNWIFNSNVNCTATNSFTDFVRGELNTNGFSLTCYGFRSQGSATRALTLGSTTITLNGSSVQAFQATGSNLTLSASSSTIICNASAQTFQALHTGLTFGTVTMSGAGAIIDTTNTITTLNLTGSGVAIINGVGTATTLTRTGTASLTDALQFNTNYTVTGTLNLNGNSITNRLLVFSNNLGVTRTITNTGVTEVWSHADFQDIAITEAFDASAITGASGNCGGNSGITFTTAATQTATGTGAFTWSTHGWTSRVPLPQDNVVISNAFTGSPTLTADMPRLGLSINMSGATGVFTVALGSGTSTLYGSLTLNSAIAAVTGTGPLNLNSRTSSTITCAGKTINASVVNISAVGGTYTLSDAFTTNTQLTFVNGTFASDNFTVTAPIYTSSGTATRAINKSTSEWIITSTAATTVWSFATTAGLTFTASNSLITLIGATANTRTFAGGGLTYGTLSYSETAGAGNLDITGSSSFAAIVAFDTAAVRTVRFTAGTTTTIRSASGIGINGTAGNLEVIASITAATHTISVASGIVSIDFVNITNSIATGGATFYAGANSVNNGGNTGWIFTAPPAPGGGIVTIIGGRIIGA